AFVLPQNWFADWSSSKVARWASFHTGDVVVAYRPKEGDRPEIWVYGVVGDAGPLGELGEATLAFNWELLRKPGRPWEVARTYKDVTSADTDSLKVAFVVLENTASAFAGNVSVDTIEPVGRRVFNSWGGEQRFKRCLERL